MSKWIEFGTVGRPHGVRGELTLWPDNPASDNRQAIKNVIISKDSQPEHGKNYKVLDSKNLKDHWLLTLAGLENRETAALLTNYHLFVDRQELTPCKEGEIYLADILGYEVCDGEKAVGLFTAVIDYPQGVYLLVKCQDGTKQGELELPWVVDFIEKIDHETQKIHCRLPEGLLELIQWK